MSDDIKKFLHKLSGQPASYSRKQHYTFGKTLGAGSFGIVRYARDNISNEEVAVKIILKKALKGNEAMIIDELELLKELHHAHIVGFRDWFESKDKFYIVTQLATGGELFDRIVQQGRFTEHDASLVVMQMLDAIQYLHSKDIVHRDLKPENILYLNQDADSNVVLADFGIAKRLQSPNEKLTSSAGSFGYAAPEVIIGTGHGKPCDIWSLGVITYTLLCGYSPFRSENVQDFVNEVKHNNAVIFHADYWKDVSKDARRFIIKALQFNPDHRPTAAELLEDAWLLKIAPEHKHTDLLPNLKQNFDAKAKFRQAIEMVKLKNRIDKLKTIQTDDDDDPNEINLFKDTSSVESSKLDTTALSSWKKFSDALNNLDPKADPKHKSDLAGSAFVQLVHAASENKERVANYKEDKPEAS
ncbi:Pkinase-domain-containing protein [Suhomyces tanzawaensis NRRL Y-17324]|uniref:calcium/calmodulin-dependent protein kinase n=1 Tax=Suhomyces tanzawaensis NRRL Y-17324 TaxID=984487 RepID=A0A1E4SSD4_9ASCO|nr:Pkinase-domain-containing protein [Suhomyces tanzawaensis NRRL Y-17324]ODV82411.1 Pkinase-domain-containing protein [Suhomyces tanzawaensis NRRL Y-17324]